MFVRGGLLFRDYYGDSFGVIRLFKEFRYFRDSGFGYLLFSYGVFGSRMMWD